MAEIGGHEFYETGNIFVRLLLRHLLRVLLFKFR